MSFGKPAMPASQPVVKAPTPDDPMAVEAQRKVAIKAQGQEGSSAYLLSGEQGVKSDPGTAERQLLGTPSAAAKTY